MKINCGNITGTAFLPERTGVRVSSLSSHLPRADAFRLTWSAAVTWAEKACEVVVRGRSRFQSPSTTQGLGEG